MHKPMLLLTLIPTVFTFVAVVLINIGGVDTNIQGRGDYLVPEQNKAYNLVNWNYTITPLLSYNSYNYHLYLNRLCTGGYREEGNYESGTCRNSRRNAVLKDGNMLYASNAWVGQIDPFRFKTVNLNIPFAFYILADLFAFFLMVATFIGAWKKPRKGKVAGFVLSTMTFLWVLAASIAVTVQMTRLKHDIETYTLSGLTLSSTPTTVGTGQTTPVEIDVNSVTLGKVVLGLTWTSTALMLIGTVLWGVFGMLGGREREVTMKEERYVQG